MVRETPPLEKPELLTSAHRVAAFDCGVLALNDYLRKFALINLQNQSERTYVAARAHDVVGYYTLAAGSVRREDTPSRVAKGLASHPVPVILLARLAVNLTEQGQRLGSGLLKDALLRCLQAADIVGCRAVAVHAKDDASVAFYQTFGFENTARNHLHLFMLMKDIKANLIGFSDP